MEKLIKCPSCNYEGSSPFLLCKDYTVTKEDFQIVSCNNCDFKYTNPRPSNIEIGRYYESQDYISHSNTSAGLINKIYQFVRVRAIQKKINLIKNLHPPDNTILDIGCGTGDFIGKFNGIGWQVTGIEPNKGARELAIRNHNIKVLDEDSVQHIEPQSFGTISMWHVLEHVHELNKRIGEIYSLLKNNGYAIIALPNYTSFDAKHYSEHWAAYDVPRHLYHFSPEVIKSLFQNNGLLHVKSLPMKMDSYYVSMLSEKYLNSKLGLIKAVYNGLKSNLAANGNAEKFSSVIYIFKRQ